MSPHGDECMRHMAHACVKEHMCVRVCACARVRVCVISGISILFRIFANPLNTQSFYTRFLQATWDYLCYVGLFFFSLLQATWHNLEPLICISNQNC